ncbi:MmgE/PrpD family protein [Mesobacillus subterraneus]|uniref:MmgE/PrpD family protein n=1 Tax=Mesobacillus subterraneus TaxID=285983 RepID=UPI0024824427|nr:MmgE/PrpD family protein [Mesobacillus subterraneus]
MKYLHAGNAAKNGIHSALLAELGFAGPAGFLEHQEGFAQAYANDYDLESVKNDLGSSFEICNTFRKKHFICGHIFPVIEALPNTHQIQNIEHISAIRVYTYKAASVLTNKNPTSFAEAKFSIPYCISSFLLYNMIKDCFEDKAAIDSLNHLSEKVHIFEEVEYTIDFPKNRRTKVEIILKNNKVVTGKVDVLKGTPENPYTLNEIAEKVINALDYKGRRELASELIYEIEALKQKDNIGSLIEIANKI